MNQVQLQAVPNHQQYGIPQPPQQQQQQQIQQGPPQQQIGAKRTVSNAGLPDMGNNMPPGHRGNDHLADLHLVNAHVNVAVNDNDGTQDLLKVVSHPDTSMLDNSDDDDDALQLGNDGHHLSGNLNTSGMSGTSMNGRDSLSSNPKTPIVGGRKTGSKNYVASEHKQFLHLVSKLQAYLEGPQGEKWVEVSLRLYRKVGYRRDPVVLHDHFVEMTNVGRTIMRENSLVFPFTGEVTINDVSPEEIEASYNELGEHIYLAFQNRAGKKLCPAAWWDAEVFGAVAHVIYEMDQNNPDALHDISLFNEQRRREIEMEEKFHESNARIILPTLDPSAAAHLSSAIKKPTLAQLPINGNGMPMNPNTGGPLLMPGTMPNTAVNTNVQPTSTSSNTSNPVVGTATVSLREDLAEIKASAKQLQKLEDRIGKLEEKMDIILQHLGVGH